MKIAVFSDLHIRLARRHDEYRLVLNEMIRQFEEIKPDYIVFCGDLIHNKNQTTPELFSIMNWLFRKLLKIAPVRILIGNHDFNMKNKDKKNPIDAILESFDDEDIMFFNNSECVLDDNIVWCVWGLKDNNEKPDVKEARETYGDKIYIGLFHGPVKGLVTNLGFSFGDGYDVDNFNDCDVVFLGDIHKRQVLTTSNKIKCIEIGSTICQDKGESITNHGYFIYDTDTKEHEFIDLINDYTIVSVKITDFDNFIDNEEFEVTNR